MAEPPLSDAAALPLACRPQCGACCIAPSIATPFLGMPQGKPAGTPCVHLTADYGCALFGRPERPTFCATLPPSLEMCGTSRAHALDYLVQLELATRPASS